MTRIHVSARLIEELLFKGLDVKITRATFSLGPPRELREFELHVEGTDVPTEAHADVICKTFNNRGADPFTTVEIKARSALVDVRIPSPETPL